MSTSSVKRTPIPKKGSLQLKDGNMPVLFCNRLGCHGRLSHTKAPINGQTVKAVNSSSEKAIVGSSSTKITLRKATSEGSPSSSQVRAKFQSQSNNSPSRKIRRREVVGNSSATSGGQTSKRVYSSSGKAVVESSTRTSSTKITLRKATSEGSPSSSQVEPDVSELKSAETDQSQSKNSPSRKIRMGVVDSSSATSGSRPPKVSKQRSGQSNQENLSTSTSNANLNRNKDVAQKQNPSAIETKIPLTGKRISRPKTVGARGSVTVPSNGISISESRHRPWCMSNSNNRASTIPSRTPAPRPSSRSNYSLTSRPLLGGSSSITGRSSIGREGLWAVQNLDQNIQRLQQLLGMEEQLLQGGMDVYDQYRDMRLDIDNMSYEDLLALEEKIGNVSVGIEEENMWKYLSRSIYGHTSLSSSSSENHNDIQCSICQEEFVNGDEVGSLSCNHSYHLTCIDQWLRRMKWCPNCKVEAAPIDSSSSSS